MATQRAIQVLSRSPSYFLMFESDTHTQKLVQGPERVIQIDKAIRSTTQQVKDTLILFTADHSYDFRINAGRKDQPLIPEFIPADFGDDLDSIKLDNVRREDEHTGEVLVAAASWTTRSCFPS